VREIITVVKLRSDWRLGFRRNWIAGNLNVGATRLDELEVSNITGK
jgi:hypothetical protein